MTPDAASSPHSLATASGLLLGALGVSMAVGALLGWIAGAWEIGLLLGAVAGIPLGVLTVYLVYSRSEPPSTRARQASPRTSHGRRGQLVSAGIFSTPRPLPSRLAPTIAGATVVALALPIFAVAGWPLEAWALAAVLWVGAQAFAFVLARLAGDPDNLAAAGMRGIGTTSRGLLVGIPLVIVTVSNETVGIAAAAVYALAFTVELAVGLASYFGGEARA